MFNKNDYTPLDHYPSFGSMYPPTFIPHKYACPGGWTTPKFVNETLSFLCEMSRNSKPDMITIQAMAVAARLYEHKMPYFWIGKDLLESLLHTDPPADMTGAELPWPYPSMCILLPENSWKDSDGSNIKYIAFSKLYKLWKNPNPRIVPVEITYKDDSPEEEMLSMAVSDIGMIWSSWLPSTKAIGMLKTVKASTYGIEHKPEDDTFSIRLGLLCANILLYLDHVQEQVSITSVEPSTCVRAASQQKGVSELWSPSWIGRNYKVRREYQGGTHSSPRVHWRRGHVRMMPVGPMSVPLKDRPRRQVRIEPVLVCAE